MAKQKDSKNQQYDAVEDFRKKILYGKEFARTREVNATLNAEELGYGKKVGQILDEYAYDPWNVQVPDQNNDNKPKNLSKEKWNNSGERGNRQLSEPEMKKDLFGFMQRAYLNTPFEELFSLAGGNSEAKKRIKNGYKGVLPKDKILTQEKEKELYQKFEKAKKAGNREEKDKIRDKLDDSKYYEQIYQQTLQEVTNYNVIQTLKGVLPKAEKDSGKELENILCEEPKKENKESQSQKQNK